jgi:hypothetical protein
MLDVSSEARKEAAKRGLKLIAEKLLLTLEI